MKKAFLLLCAVFALLLCSCDRTPGDVETESGKAAQSTEASAAADTAGSDTVESTKAVNPEPYVLKTDPADQIQAHLDGHFVETPEGYYCIQNKETVKGNVSLLFFCPRGGDTFRPLCGKPNCRHVDENCNAWVGRDLVCFGYYNGSLYAFDNGDQFSVVKMNLDGTDHQVVASIDHDALRDYGYTAEFHHGKLFIWCWAVQELPLEEQVDRLIMLDLSDGSQKELASEFLRTASLPDPEVFYKDKLYMLGTGDKTENISADNVDESKLIEVDTVTGEARIVLPRPINGLYVTDSTWYYFEPDTNAVAYTIRDNKPGFWEYDVESGTVRDCGLPLPDIQGACYDEDFIYARNFHPVLDGPRTIYFLSRDYKLLDQIELESRQYFAVAMSDRIFIYQIGTGGKITHYIDKSKIGTGELELIPIKTVK